MNRLLTVVALLPSLIGTVEARTWVVEVDGSGDAPTIQAGIDSASAGDSVEVGPGVYHETVYLTGGIDIHLRSRLGPEATVLDGDGKRYVMFMDAGIVEGFTMRNGAGQTGPGLYVGQAAVVTSPIVRNNIIENNRAAVMPDCCNAGGLYNSAGGTRIEGNLIRNNEVMGAGGGLYDDGFDTVITNNVIAFNWAQYNTGGMFTARGSVSHNLILGNYGGYANGGAYIGEGGVFRNNTVYGNSTANAFNNAAGVWVECDSVEENVIVRNHGGHVGIGLITLNSSAVHCNDVWGNDIDEISGSSDASNFSADPLFCDRNPLATLSFTLNSTSPCAPGQSPNGSCGLVGAGSIGCPVSDAVDLGTLAAGLSVTPNPPRTTATIAFSLGPDERPARLTVYDLRGRVVARLATPGNPLFARGSVTWDGHDSSGNAIATGIYLVRLETGRRAVARKIVWLR